MTSNQRRPGFRLPWSSDEEANQAAAADAAANGNTPPADEPKPPEAGGGQEESELAAPAATPPEPVQTGGPISRATASSPSSLRALAPKPTMAPPPQAEATPSPAEPAAGFMRDLVAAMRRVAEETRQASLSDLRSRSEEQVQSLEADSERLRGELKTRAEADIAGVGVWARAEEERIKNEAEQRVVGRRAQLDQQLAAEASRAEAEAKALRDRVAAYEGQLDAYHAQLSDIADPAAFATAAKRMPAPPDLGTVPAPPRAADVAPAATIPAGHPDPSPEIHPAEEEVLSARLAELDATLDAVPDSEAAPTASTASGESTATEVLVKGLGSFGAITGFRQSLASVDGIDGVSLSLGPTGEFVFRAVHSAGFDLSGAISALEGDGATIEARPEGGLRVTLDRAR